MTGDELRGLRVKLGMSLVDVASHLTISRSCVTGIENGRISTNSNSAQEYARFLLKCGRKAGIEYTIGECVEPEKSPATVQHLRMTSTIWDEWEDTCAETARLLEIYKPKPIYITWIDSNRK